MVGRAQVMAIRVQKTELKNILLLRNLFLQENNVQIRYNACHERGWTNSYLVTYNDLEIGYGSIKGNEMIEDRDTAFEFYIIPPFRHLTREAFITFLNISEASFIECQSNVAYLTSLLREFGENISEDVVLFEEGHTTTLYHNETTFRTRSDTDVIFEHKAEPLGDYVLEFRGEIVATGGFLLHYNKPFADLYMEVKEEYRRQGFGSLLVQEVKTQCYLAGRVPAARTGIKNLASQATLSKAGFKVAGYVLLSKVK